MLRGYVSAGFDPEQFWSLSPRMYLAHMSGAADRIKREGRDRIEAAWTTAALSRADKMPRLAKILGEEPLKQRPEEVAARLAALSSSLPTITQAEWRARRTAS